jgi:peptidyl-prolyl cis-trans isomerase B (cyclophilin B)
MHPTPDAHGRKPTAVRVLLAMAMVLILVSGVGVVVALLSSGGRHRPAAKKPATSLATIGTSGSPTSAECQYPATTDGGRPAAKPYPQPTILGRPHVRMYTDQGTVELELTGDIAPCTVNSFLTLARAGYFTNVQCHRLTTEGIYVLQCGDPSGTGEGGPGYRFNDENLPIGRKPAYPRGTLAMANAGPGTNGSQFFLVYRDSEIDPNYPVFGTVTAGMDVVEKVAGGGTDDANGPGDGHPKLEVTISQIS